jgi:hypothetical protein
MDPPRKGVVVAATRNLSRASWPAPTHLLWMLGVMTKARRVETVHPTCQAGESSVERARPRIHARRVEITSAAISQIRVECGRAWTSMYMRMRSRCA